MYKRQILQASLRLFARAGFEATGMREIAAAVGIQPASVYKHFAGKQAIQMCIRDSPAP